MKKIIAIAMILGFGFKALAAGYGAAGCGLGSLVFEGKNEWYEQTMAATTNATFANQTFGITFGTLNCDANKLNASSEKAQVYIAGNKNAVLNELALGQGDSVSVLSHIFNCSNTASFADLMKSNYDKVISNKDLSSEKIVENINQILGSSKVCNTNLG